MNFCESCGNKLNPGEEFCSGCGKKAIENAETEESINGESNYSRANQTNYSTSTLSSNLKVNWNKRKIIVLAIAMVLIIAIIGAVSGQSLTNKDKIIKDFVQAVTKKNAKKMAGLLVSSDPRIKVDENSLKPLLDYAENNPSWLQSVISGADIELETIKKQKNEDNIEAFNSGLINDGDLKLKKDGKAFLFFDRYVFEVKPYFINISTNLKGSEIFINDVSVGISDKENFTKQFGPYLPGTYKLRSTYRGEYASLEGSDEISIVDSNGYGFSEDRVVDVSLSINAIYTDITCNFPDAKLFVNGKETGVYARDAKHFGPVDDNVKIRAQKEFPWGNMSSEEVSVGNKRYHKLHIPGVDEGIKNNLMEALNKYNQSSISAIIERDPSKYVNVTAEKLKSLANGIDDMKRNDRCYKGKLLKIVYSLDSMQVEQKDGKYYASVTAMESYDGAYYYKNDKNVNTRQSNPIWGYSLEYDEKNKEWLVNGADTLWYADFSKNIKEFTF